MLHMVTNFPKFDRTLTKDHNDIMTVMFMKLNSTTPSTLRLHVSKKILFALPCTKARSENDTIIIGSYEYLLISITHRPPPVSARLSCGTIARVSQENEHIQYSVPVYNKFLTEQHSCQERKNK